MLVHRFGADAQDCDASAGWSLAASSKAEREKPDKDEVRNSREAVAEGRTAVFGSVCASFVTAKSTRSTCGHRRNGHKVRAD